MEVPVLIPTPLRAFTGGARRVPVRATTVGEALDQLALRFPPLRAQLFADGGLRAFVNVFVNDENARDLDGPATRLASGDVLDLIPSIAGG
ncbi:MoaD family protein [Gemmatimonadetes bacterium T265]|nr:MoaD family protein [Gemmatimonadetes bacterium T265]